VDAQRGRSRRSRRERVESDPTARPLCGWSAALWFEYPEDFGFLQDHPVGAVDQNFGAGPFSEQHAVADTDFGRVKRASVVARTRADGQRLALGGFFLGGIGNDDAAGGGFLGLDPLQQNPILQRPETRHLSVLRSVHSML